ncbi:uncharacterized protein LOC134534116 [Bacillus rossius redtenbacheri]|uniref:uncharacterized protein LOC134534116 n=1 Tax=Bacillus rossius redtenbacheri TaxID=93214 RepID=UPI002FDEF61B
MDFSFLTFSPPKRNSRIPKLGCKHRKSKSPVTMPRNLPAFHKDKELQKITTSLSTRELYSGCCTNSKHKSRGKENREKVTPRRFPNHFSSKTHSPVMSVSKKIFFKPCGRTNCSPPKEEFSKNSSITVISDNSIVNTSNVSSNAKETNVEFCQQQESCATGSGDVDDSVVVVSDTSCSIGDIQKAFKLISVKEKSKSARDSSVYIVNESGSSGTSSVNVGSAKKLVADISNIIPNTSSSDESNTKTPRKFPLGRSHNFFCSESRTVGHRIRNFPSHTDNVLVGCSTHVASSDRDDSLLVGSKIGVGNGRDDSNAVSKKGKHIVTQLENTKPKGKSRPAKPYKETLQNSVRQCLLREACESGVKGVVHERNRRTENTFSVERNLQSNTSGNVPKEETGLSTEGGGDKATAPDCDADMDDQSGIKTLSPVAVSTPLLSSTKYREVENWLNANDFHSAEESISDGKTDRSGLKAISVSSTPNRTDDGLSVSTVEILTKVYGSDWRSADIRKKCYTEPVQKHRPFKDAESPRIKHVKTNGQTKRSSSSSSGGDDKLSEFLKTVYCGGKPDKRRQLLSTPDFIDDNSVENSPTLYLKIQSLDVKTDVKKTRRLLQESSGSASSNSGEENGVVRKLDFLIPESGSSEKSTPARVKQLPVVKKNKKVLAVKGRESKKTAGVTVFVKKEQKVCTRRASLRTQPTLSFLSSLSAPTPDGKCDAEARYFKKNFSKLKEELGIKLFQLFNEKVFDNKLPHDMPLEWNVRMKQTAGYCYSKRTLSSTGEKIRTSRIVLSTKVIATPDRLRDTLIHEMCHAAAWILDMAKDGHGPRWKAWAKRASAAFPELPPIRRCHDYNIHTKFTYRCVGCGYSFGRHSKSLNLTVKRCGYCFGEFELLLNTKNKAGVVVQTPKPHRSPRGFARFVKDNYNAIKKSKPSLKHGDVMKLLSEKFKGKQQKPSS